MKNYKLDIPTQQS